MPNTRKVLDKAIKAMDADGGRKLVKEKGGYKMFLNEYGRYEIWFPGDKSPHMILGKPSAEYIFSELAK